MATNEQERQALGRVFPEPVRSVDFINHGPTNGPEELRLGFEFLEQLYPGYLEFTTVADELGDSNAVSLGPDGLPAWDPDDADDGYPFYVAKVTDESVPDSQKDYVLLLNAHPAEPCGQEGMPRFLEDLLIWRDTEPDHVLDDASGLNDQPHKISVAELLRRVKVFFVSPSPDGWAGGDGPGPADNGNAAGFNSNRVAYQDGWVFPATEELYDRGYSSLTQPEGAAVSRYLRRVRDTELGGRAFAVANDQHGPVPTSGAIIYQTEQGSDPAKVERVYDYGRRLEQNMDEVFAKYFTGEGLNGSQQLALEAGNVRDLLLQKYNEQVGSFDEKAAYLTLEWADAATAWEHIDYTVGSSWGGFAGSQSGLGADSIGFETACRPFAAGFDPAMFQLFVDNVRAASETGVVHAAQREGRADPPPVATHDVGGKVGFVETGKRITDSDGNPSPPPLGHPGTPLLEQVAQAPYDVSNTDYFRDLRPIVSNPIVEVPTAGLRRNTQKLSTLVVADTPEVNAAALKRFATGGGNLVLTDGALQLLPRLTDMPADAVRMRTAYVGYSDLDRSHPWTQNLYLQARQMFDPVGLGYPLLMERDQYWPCSATCDESGTENSAPAWTTDRAAWEERGGETIATADPLGGKAQSEGTKTDRTAIGTLPLGKGRIVVFGALLPQPTESYDHWFGVNAYTVSIPGQQLLLEALRWSDSSSPGLAKSRRCGRRSVTFSLPGRRGKRLRSARVYVNGKRVRVIGGRRLRAPV
ncbi:MAG: hypothetical protein ACRDJY_12305, partial [Thermoleophilaceae bacterium]